MTVHRIGIETANLALSSDEIARVLAVCVQVTIEDRLSDDVLMILEGQAQAFADILEKVYGERFDKAQFLRRTQTTS